MILEPLCGGPRSSVIRSTFALACVCLAGIALPASAQSTLYWDANGDDPGTGGSGAWDTIGSDWKSFGGDDFRWVNDYSDTAVFGGTSGDVILGQHITAAALYFTTPDYTIGPNYQITLNEIGTIGTNLGNQTFFSNVSSRIIPDFTSILIKNGSGSLLLEYGGGLTGEVVRLQNGTTNVGVSGSISADYNLEIGTTNGEVGNLLLTGGSISSSSSYIGRAGSGTATVTSGTWTNSGNLHVGYAQQGDLTINGGSVVVEGGANIGRLTQTGNLTLSGTSGNRGILSPSQLIIANNSSTVTFDGGILQARANHSDFVSTSGGLTINSGGAFIDSNSFEIEISAPLSGSGGFNKLGAGTLKLSDANTYTGGTVVNSGTLELSSGGSISHSATNTTIGSVNGDVGVLKLSGGTLSNNTGTIGDATGSQGDATVTSGTWTHSNILIVGNSGTGNLLINGGTVTSPRTALGFNASGNGSATVTSGGALTNSSELKVGCAGTGSLTVSGGGLVTIKSVKTADFAGSTGTITLSGTSGDRGTLTTNQILEGAGDGNVIFDGGIFQAQINESNIISDFESGDVTINAGGAFIDSNGHTIGISGPLTGTGGLNKLGAGTLTLNGANTYAGGTTVEAGTLLLGASGAVAPNTPHTVNGGTLDLNNFDLTASSLSGTGGLVDIGTANLTVDQSGNTTYGGIISGTGGLTKQGTDKLTLSGTHTYTGGTTISGGTLQLGHATNTLVDTGTVTISGGTLALGTNSDTVGAVTLSSGNITGSGGTLTAPSYAFTNSGSVSANLAGSSALTKTGAGTVTLSGANTYTGGTVVNSGTLDLISGGSISSATANTTLGNGSADVGTLRLNSGSALTTNNLLIGNSGTGNLLIIGGTHNSATATIAFNASSVGNVAVSGGSWTNASSLLVGRGSSGSLAVSNGGLVTIEGITYTGFFGGGTGTIALSGTSGNRGTLATNQVDERIGGSEGTVTFDGGILQARIDETNFIANYESGDVTINAGGAFIDSNGHAIGINSPFGGSGGLTKLGAGILTLNGTHTYAGGTTVEAGALAQGTSGAFTSNTGYTVNGGTLFLNNFDLTASSFSGTGGSIDLGSAKLTLNQSTHTTYDGVITGPGGSLTKQGAGTLTLSSASTYTGGTTVNGGLINFASADNFGTAAITLDGGGLKWASGNTFDISNRLNPLGAAGGTFDTNSNNVNLATTAISGTGSLTKQGAGTLTLSGANTYTGGTTVNGGLINFASADNFGTAAVTLDGGGLKWASGNTLDISARLNPIGSAGATFDTNGNNVTFASTMSGTGSLTKEGAGTLTQGASGAFVSGTDYTVNSGVLDLNDFDLTTTALSGSGGSVDLGTADLIVNQSANTAYAGAINGTGRLTKQGAGTFTLSGANNYSGGTTISGGTLQGNSSSLTGDIITHAALVFDQDIMGTHTGDISGSGTLTKQGVGTLTLSGTNTYSGGTTLSGGTLIGSATSLTGNITNNGVLIFDQSTPGTHSGDISGSGFLTKSGSGTLTLSGTNTYTGTTTVNGGLINFSSGENLGTAAITLDGGGLRWASGNTHDISNRLNPLGAAGATFDTNNNNVTLAAAISGTGVFSKQGAGILTLNGTNTYTGTTTVNGGLINFAHGDNLGTAAITLDGGGLQWATGNTLDISNRLNPLGAAGGTFDTNGNNVTLASPVTGTGGLIKKGTGTLTFAESFADITPYTGGTTVNDGLLKFSREDNLGTGAITLDGGGLQWATGNTHDISNRLNPLGAAGATFDTNNNDVILASAISGTGGLTKAGAGTLTLSGTNSYNGSILNSAGTLQGSSASLQGDIINNASLVFDQSTPGTYSSAITGTGGVTKQGAGTLTLSGTNSYNGNSTVSGGSLNVSTGGSVTNAQGFIGFGSGDTASVDVAGNWTNSSHLAAGYSGNGSLTIQTGGTVSNTTGNLGQLSGSSGTADVSGTWTNSSSLIVGNSGNGDLTIQSGGTVSNTWSSIGENAGVTGSADVAGAWNNSDEIYVGYKGNGSLIIRDGGTVSHDNRIYIGHSSGGTGTADVAGIWNSSDRVFVGLGGSGTLTIQDGGAVNAKSGTSFTTLGNTSGSTGTLNITGSTTAGILNTVSVHGGSGTATLNFNHTDSDYHFTKTGASGGTAVAITGSTAVNHLGTGTTTLSGTNTYTGNTTVSAGTLHLNGTAPNSAFNVAGGRLSGSGTIGQLTLGNGGILAPGNSPGTLSASDTTWEGGATFEWEVNNAAGIVSTNWDLLNITGGLTINATSGNLFTINLVSLTAADLAGQVPNFNPDANASWTFVQTTTGISYGSGASIGASFALNTAGFQNSLNGTFGIAQDGNNLNVTYTTSAVPEPGTFALLAGLITLGFSATRRRSRRNP
ncbi:MAG: autotransporter-associated beta strand repeat-containing protein [Synoicihabitans sp.]